MSTRSYIPTSNAGIGDMLTALATKYNVTTEEIASITQAQLVWG